MSISTALFKSLRKAFEEAVEDYLQTCREQGKEPEHPFKGSFNIRVESRTRDMDCKVEIRKLDITAFKPYYQKKSDVNVTKGTLDLDMDTKVTSRKMNAPGKAVLKDLEFEKRPGVGGTFLNIPLSAVILFLKNNNNEIAVNFVMEGDLDNPKFTLRESFMNKIAIAMAEQLGLSVKKIGESIVILGAEGTKEAEKGVKGIGESIKKLFK